MDVYNLHTKLLKTSGSQSLGESSHQVTILFFIALWKEQDK